MPNKLQQRKAAQDLAMFFAEMGKVPTQREYIESEDKPLLFSAVRRIFRSYSRMLKLVKSQEPELFEQAEGTAVEEKPEEKADDKAKKMAEAMKQQKETAQKTSNPSEDTVEKDG